ncbi:hypothetical protein BH11MYX4_BH11MYX4_42720 [soil metagenome]
MIASILAFAPSTFAQEYLLLVGLTCRAATVALTVGS